jgi:hypothetical protein
MNNEQYSAYVLFAIRYFYLMYSTHCVPQMSSIQHMKCIANDSYSYKLYSAGIQYNIQHETYSTYKQGSIVHINCVQPVNSLTNDKYSAYKQYPANECIILFGT